MPKHNAPVIPQIVASLRTLGCRGTVMLHGGMNSRQKSGSPIDNGCYPVLTIGLQRPANPRKL